MRLLVVVAGDPEGIAGAEWALSKEGWEAVVVTTESAAPSLEGVDAVWIHGDAKPDLTPEVAAGLNDWLGSGGGMVLSLAAVRLSSRFGLGCQAPQVSDTQIWSHEGDPLWSNDFHDWPDYPHIRGLQGWPEGSHPLFDGLMRGTYTWAPSPGERWISATYTKPDWPDGYARVVAVERAYVQLNASVAVAWEYEAGEGRVLCLGAHARFRASDGRFSAQLDHLMTNALVDATLTTRRSRERERASWPQARDQHAAVGVLPRARDLPLSTSPLVETGCKKRTDADGSPFTLAAQHVVVTGTEDRGIGEIWLHPLCVVRGFDLRVNSAHVVAHEFEITPAEARRVIRTPSGAMLEERIVPDPSAASLFWQLRPVGSEAFDMGGVELTLGLPLTLEWPIPSDALHPRRVEIVEQGNAHVLVITGRDARHVAAIFASGAAVPEIVEEGSDGIVMRLRGVSSRGVALAITASTTGAHGLPARSSMSAALERQASRWRELADRTARLTTNDPELYGSWQWAVARLANFVAWSPYDQKRGLMAGYAQSHRGWGRSRPGYAWFFGRDTCWSVDALLATGMHEEARDAISFLAESADVTGKIAHEITTSGVTHYDAADSTPLFLRAVAAYAEWTGDARQVQAWWPAVEKAIAYCRSCDRDGDGLPENTHVGHGWVESGPLGGGAVTSYVAAIWLDALMRIESVAALIGNVTATDELRQMALAATAGMEALRDPASGRLALHRAADGSLATELTALDTVPIALGVDKGSAADEIVDVLGAPSFTTPWGLRMLSQNDPRYDPRGYHTGSVWPLFTGWAALADARCGRVRRAWDRVHSIAALTERGCKGAFDEVLDGDTGAGAGVCPDQAWSAAMMISPVVYGLLGVRPDALRREIAISPALSQLTGAVTLENLRFADARLNVSCSKSGEQTAIELSVLGADAPLVVVAGGQRLHLASGERATINVVESN